MRGFLILAGVLGACLGLLYVPARLELSGAVETGSGRLCLIVRWLFFQTRIHFDLCLLDAPSMTLLIRHGRALTVRPLFGANDGEKPRFTESLRRALRVKALRLVLHVGVRDDPAATAMLGGVLEQTIRHAMGVYMPQTTHKLRTAVRPLWNDNLLRLGVRGIADAFPAQIIHAWLKHAAQTRSSKRRSKNHGASH